MHTYTNDIAILVAPAGADPAAAFEAWTGQSYAGPGWRPLRPEQLLIVDLPDEPADTIEEDLPASATCDRTAPHLRIQAPISAWAAWAGPGLLAHTADGHGIAIL